VRVRVVLSWCHDALAHVLAALLAVSLVSCTAAAPDASPTESPGAEEPTHPEEPTAPPPLSELSLTTEGLGSIKVGEAPSADGDPAAMLVFDPEFCTDERTGLDLGIEPGSNAAGLWLPAEQYRFEQSPGFVDAPFGVGVWDTAVQRIEVADPVITTDAGITFDSTAAEIAAAYETVEVVPMGITTLHVVNGTAGKLVFEVATEDPKLPGYWPASMLGRVVLLRTIAAEEELFSTAGSGNVVNTCPA
jgi:hypothetical protein